MSAAAESSVPSEGHAPGPRGPSEGGSGTRKAPPSGSPPSDFGNRSYSAVAAANPSHAVMGEKGKSNGKGVCHHCKKPGHVKARCPSMECRRCGEKGHMQFACPQEGPPEVDLSTLLKSMVVSKEEEESMRYNANKWADALAERDALERKMDRVMKELAEKKRAVQEWGKKIQSSITGTKRYTK